MASGKREKEHAKAQGEADDRKAAMRNWYSVRSETLETAKAVYSSQIANADDPELVSPRDFEFMVAAAYERRGYEVLVTAATDDGGKDVVARRTGEVLYIECKQYTSKKVGRPEIQKLVGAIPRDGGASGVFVTTSSYSQPARDYAQDRDVELVEGAGLVDLLRHAVPEQLTTAAVPCPICTAPVDLSADGESSGECPSGHAVRNGYLLACLAHLRGESVACPDHGVAMAPKMIEGLRRDVCQHHPACHESIPPYQPRHFAQFAQ